jgi:hypothetical protein
MWMIFIEPERERKSTRTRYRSLIRGAMRSKFIVFILTKDKEKNSQMRLSLVMCA